MELGGGRNLGRVIIGILCRRKKFHVPYISWSIFIKVPQHSLPPTRPLQCRLSSSSTHFTASPSLHTSLLLYSFPSSHLPIPEPFFFIFPLKHSPFSIYTKPPYIFTPYSSLSSYCYVFLPPYSLY